MNYIQQAFLGLFDWWRYLIGTVIIFIAWQIIGMIPLLIFIGIEVANGASLAITTDIAQMAELLGKNLFLFLMLFSFAIGLLGVVFCSKYLHNQSFVKLTTTRPSVDWKRFWFIFIIWGLYSTATTALSFNMAPEDYIYNLNLKPFLILLALVIFLMPLQTSFEEYFFRGYLMQGLGVVFKNKWMPLILTSVGFGLLHGLNPEVDKLGPIMMVFYIGTGLVLGIMTLMDDGLELALGFHAANNMFTAFLVTADWSALQTDALLTYTADPSKMTVSEIVLPVLIVYPILLFILSKKYGWTNWKEKLFGEVKELPKDDYKVLE
ncbi:CAAX protease family protein [Winogradskyella sp. PC-19]|nr:CPBP family intramembrane glutamic endopeptidase [Winogradskyella sp.]ARV08768.1 CAAX protease family protein [Winogradskyella sp. PC-19]RZN75552.1 MAG: CPBP family intramembrane metalloprotease [Winogradskyella sp.]